MSKEKLHEHGDDWKIDRDRREAEIGESASEGIQRKEGMRDVKCAPVFGTEGSLKNVGYPEGRDTYR
ncbi:hypothetical protein K474DRAFT_1665080 [Panus rudis PR-1116 ss-1]|nr:hypothetical protein K474DRAFT_1665080 [Panus rudis PR-1116 ss-1]